MKSSLIPVLSILVCLCCDRLDSSDRYDESLSLARKRVDAEIDVLRRHNGNPLLLSLKAEKRRLSKDIDIVHRIPLNDIELPAFGVSPFGVVDSVIKLKPRDTWAFRFQDEKVMVVSGISGNLHGMRFFAGPYGDVSEISYLEAKAKFGLNGFCSPSRVILMRVNRYQ